jgi:hypothetical protein
MPAESQLSRLAAAKARPAHLQEKTANECMFYRFVLSPHFHAAKTLT